MEHSEAVGNQSVERYLLGAMPESEAESFEKHFFECTMCAADLESGMLFAENLKALPVPESAVRGAASPAAAGTARGQWDWLRKWWRQPMVVAPAFSTAVLAAIVVYQAGFVIPALRTRALEATGPQGLLVFALKSATRGENNRIAVPAGSRSFALDVDLADNSFPNYRCDLYDGSGKIHFSLDCPAPRAGNPLSILIPVRGLHSGAYTLDVRGGNGAAAAGAVIVHDAFLLQVR